VRSVLKTDTIFDDPLGRYLTQPNIPLKDHLASLQGALSLTDVEISEILIDGGQDVSTAVLTLDTVSLLYRYQLLAKALKLTVSELISLKALSGLNPFAAINLNITKLTEDVPFTQTLKFIEMTTAMKNSNFHAEDLDYLCRHRFDPVGKYRSNPDELLNLVKSLTTEIQRIRSEHAIPQDALSFTDERIQQKLALVFPPDVVQTFMSMWTGTIEYKVSQSAVKSVDRLNPESFNSDTQIKVSYDETREIQNLSFRGVLTEAKKKQLIAENNSLILQALLDAVQVQVIKTKTFFSINFEKSTIGTKAIGFLDLTDFESLFESIPSNAIDAQSQDLKKREKLAKGFLPFIQQRLIQQLIVQSMANTLQTDLSIAETLLTNANLLAESSSSTTPLVDAFAALGAAGVSVTYVAAGNISQPAINVNAIDTAKKPNGAIAAKCEGYLEVPRTGAYRFSLVFTGVAAAAELKFNHQPNSFITGQGKATAADPDVTIGNFLELKAGVPYSYSFNAANLGNGDVELQVQSEDLPKGSIDRLTLYPRTNIDRVDRATILLKKTLQIVQGFGLTERELRYLLINRADFSDLNFSLLPTKEISTISNNSRSLFQQFLRLANYTQLKKDLGDSENGLITIFENSSRAFPTELVANTDTTFNNLCQKLAELTRRKVETIKSVARYFGFTPVSVGDNNLNLTIAGFNNERGIEKLWKVLQILEKFGVSIDPISKWIVPEPTAEIARDLRNMLKARYEEDTWQRIAQPIFDRLRQQKRDALVAYVMHNHPEGFQNVNQLFEFFLIDPEMEPVVQTSRLRLAISSVQLFIQRCLLNLEKFVHPSAIDSKHWQWMKRYRVWEANRKIFLFPENWLEPEFRDDKTHLFQELEGALLQGDVSNDLAEDAFFKYLKKLDELAQLEIVTMYIEEHPDPAQNILHVIGRTHNLPHKYFYRRYKNGMWTPWEPVTTEIEGDHIVAVMWHGRLNLFWVTFLEKAESKPIAPPTTTLLNLNFGNIVNSVQKIVEVQLNWSEYFQGQWTTRGSNGFGNPIRKEVDINFDRRKVFTYVSQDADGDAVCINLQEGGFNDSFRVLSKNSQPKNVDLKDVRFLPPYDLGRGDLVNKYENIPQSKNKANRPLEVQYLETIMTKNSEIPEQRKSSTTKTILNKRDSFSVLMPSNKPALQSPEIASLASPFFYQDDRHTFFVEPSLTITKKLIEWDDWALQKPRRRLLDEYISAIPVPQIPRLDAELLTDLKKIVINPESRQVFTRSDWAINPATVFTFQDRLIGERGSIDSKVLLNNNTKIENLINLADGVNNLAPIEINTPAVITPNLDVLRNIVEIDPGNLLQPGDLINIIGNGGLDRVAIENLDRVNIDRQIFINQ
jgi:Neuraminidase-like domain